MTDFNEGFYNNLLIIFSKVTLGFKVLPIFIAIWNRRNLNKSLKVLLSHKIAAVSIGLFVQLFIWVATYHIYIIMPFIKAFKIENTNFFQILYYTIDFVLIGYFFSLILKPYRLSELIKVISSIFLISIIINYLFIEGHNVYGVFNPVCDAIFTFIIPLLYMWFLFKKTTIVPLNKNPYFWVNVGLIVTNLVALYGFFVGNKLQQTDFILYVKISILNQISSIIGSVLIAIGFYYARYTKYLPRNTPSVNK